MKRMVTGILLLVIVLGLPSCSVYRVNVEQDPGIEIPRTFGVASGEYDLDNPWWEVFGSTRLNDVVDEALRQNPTMLQAWARIRQAEAVARQTGAGRYPRLDLQGGTTRSRSYASGIPGVQPSEPSAVSGRQHSLVLAASYEIDLWGRVSSLDKAARQDLKATRFDAQTVMMTVSAEVAQTWFGLIGAREQLELARAQVEASRTQLELVEFRYSRGLAPALSVYQQRQQLAARQAQIPLVQAQVELLVHQLNILLGRPPSTPVGEVPAELPDLWPLPDAGVPAEMLQRRPDVQAAQQRVKAADYRVASAVAERFPRLSITGSRGFGAESFADLFDRMIWNVAGNVVGPLFDAGARKSEVRRTKAVVEELLHAYGQEVLTALGEVEDALVREKTQTEYVRELTSGLEAARNTLDQARSEYLAGVEDYLPVLDALNAYQQAQRDLLEARSRLIDYRVQLCRALGGTWTAGVMQEIKTGENS